MNYTMLAAINGSEALKQLLVLLIVGIVLGIIDWLVQAAPFINAMFKTVIRWLIILVGAIILVNFLLGLIGHQFITI